MGACVVGPCKPSILTHGHSVHVPIQTLEYLMSEDGWHWLLNLSTLNDFLFSDCPRVDALP